MESLVEARGKGDRFDSDHRSRSYRLVASCRKTRRSGPRRRKARGRASAESEGGPYERKVDRMFIAGNSVDDRRGRCGRIFATPYLNQRTIIGI